MGYILKEGKITKADLGKFFGVTGASITAYWTNYGNKLKEYANFHIDEKKQIIIDKVIKAEYFSIMLALEELLLKNFDFENSFFDSRVFYLEHEQEIEDILEKGESTKKGITAGIFYLDNLISKKFYAIDTIVVKDSEEIREPSKVDMEQLEEVCVDFAKETAEAVVKKYSYAELGRQIGNMFKERYGKELDVKKRLRHRNY